MEWNGNGKAFRDSSGERARGAGMGTEYRFRVGIDKNMSIPGARLFF